MARVDFYILNQAGQHSRQTFACRLAEKAYRLQNTVHIQAGSRADADRLDELLWTFRDGSFVPHEVLGSAPEDPASPVTIGCDDTSRADCDLLINLGESIPDSASSFPRVAEVVTSDEDSKTQSRQRFVDYRDQGHTLNTHKL